MPDHRTLLHGDNVRCHAALPIPTHASNTPRYASDTGHVFTVLCAHSNRRDEQVPHLDSKCAPHIVMAFSIHNQTLDTITFPNSAPPPEGEKTISEPHIRVCAKTPALAFSTTLVHAGAAKTLPGHIKELPWAESGRFFFFVFDAKHTPDIATCAQEQNLPRLSELNLKEDSSSMIKV